MKKKLKFTLSIFLGSRASLKLQCVKAVVCARRFKGLPDGSWLTHCCRTVALYQNLVEFFTRVLFHRHINKMNIFTNCVVFYSDSLIWKSQTHCCVPLKAWSNTVKGNEILRRGRSILRMKLVKVKGDVRLSNQITCLEFPWG